MAFPKLQDIIFLGFLVNDTIVQIIMKFRIRFYYRSNLILSKLVAIFLQGMKLANFVMTHKVHNYENNIFF